MSRRIKYRSEDVFDRFFNNSDSDLGSFSSGNECEDNILSQTGQEYVIWTIGTPSSQRRAGKNRTVDPTNMAPHQPLAN